jgi:hypothetical protein
VSCLKIGYSFFFTIYVLINERKRTANADQGGGAREPARAAVRRRRSPYLDSRALCVISKRKYREICVYGTRRETGATQTDIRSDASSLVLHAVSAAPGDGSF